MRITRRWRLPLLLWGVRPPSAFVELDEGRLRARFGRWRIDQPLGNVASVEVTGPYRWWRAIGLRMSLRDRGLTFGTSAHGGVCVRFNEPVRLFGLAHPNLTLTADDLAGLAEALRRRGVPG